MAEAQVTGVLTLTVQLRIEEGHEDGPQIHWSVNAIPEQAGNLGLVGRASGRTDDATSATYGVREGVEAALFAFIEHLDDIDMRERS